MKHFVQSGYDVPSHVLAPESSSGVSASSRHRCALAVRRLPWLAWLGALSLLLVLAAGCSKKPPLDVDPNGDVGMETDGMNNNGTDSNGGNTGDTGGQDLPRSLEDVFFDYDRFALRPEARRVLEANADLLKANGDWFVILEGHCDERGTVEYNLALGEKRARAAKDYMVQRGVEATRMRTISYGEERPFDRGHSESAWAQNRRVHFVQQ